MMAIMSKMGPVFFICCRFPLYTVQDLQILTLKTTQSSKCGGNQTPEVNVPADSKLCSVYPVWPGAVWGGLLLNRSCQTRCLSSFASQLHTHLSQVPQAPALQLNQPSHPTWYWCGRFWKGWLPSMSFHCLAVVPDCPTLCWIMVLIIYTLHIYIIKVKVIKVNLLIRSSWQTFKQTLAVLCESMWPACTLVLLAPPTAMLHFGQSV